MMKKRLAMVLAIFLVLMTAACGSSPSSEGADAAGSDGAEKTEITIWAWDEDFNVKAANIAKEYYEKEHQDVTVTIENRSFTDIVQKLNTAFAAENYEGLPNIVLVEDYTVGGYMNAFPGCFRDLSGIVKPEDWMPFKMKAVTSGDKVYGVPFDNAVAAAFYRTDYLEAAGYQIEDMQDITWDEFIEIGKKVKETTGIPMCQMVSQDFAIMMIMMQSAGTWYVGEDGETLNIADNETIKECLEVIKKLKEADIVLEIPGWDEEVQAIQQGKVASIIDGSWSAATIQTADDQSGNWAIAPIPRLSRASEATNYSNRGGSSWYVLDQVEHADVAADFLDQTFANNTELLNECVGAIHYVSARVNNGEFTNYDAEEAFFGGQRIYELLNEWSARVPAVTYGINTLNIDNIVQEELQNIYSGADIDAVMKTIEERAASIY